MDDELFDLLYHIAHRLWPKREPRVQYAGRLIVLMFLWSAIRNKPLCWVCDRRNLPGRLADLPIPSRSQFARRLCCPDVVAMIDELEQAVNDVHIAGLIGLWLIDAKPLIVSPYSKDKAARWGWAYNGKARGYKLFMIVDAAGRVVAWHVDSMNRAEPDAAGQLVDRLDRPGYLIGDSIYDSNPLHALTAEREVQLIAPRKRPGTGLGHGVKHHPNRLHAIAMLECTNNPMGTTLYAQRTEIERSFARMASSRVGLDRLPPFIRSPRRVRRWVQAKIILYALTK